MTDVIIDTAQNAAAEIVHLQADNIATVMRYLTSNLRLTLAEAVAPVRSLGLTLTARQGSSKLVTPAEAKALGTAGIRLGLVFENGGGSPGYNDINAVHGLSDASFALNYLPQIGAPTDGTVCVFFACDNDFTAAQIQQLVLPYFGEIATKFSPAPYIVGVYGSGAVCNAVCAKGFARYAWLSGSLGWTDSRTYLASKPKELVLVQHDMNTKLANLGCDTDYALAPFGDFLVAA